MSFDFEKQFSTMKKASWRIRTAPVSHRIEALEKFKNLILKSESQIIEALKKDFQKPEAESLVTELYPVINEINFILRHLKDWARPQRRPGSLFLMGATSEVLHEPKGVVLVISPWNYPFSLAINPLVSAIAAGNCVVLKPSELTPNVSQVILELCSECFSADHVKVYCGGKDVAEQLLTFSFDHIFFTGSTQVGRIVMQAASKNLVPVTLELGGKSPTIVDDSADLALAARKIVWGKLINNGQTCIAPDYLLVDQKVLRQFVGHFKSEIEKQKNISSLIITERHADRLRAGTEQLKSAGAEILLQVTPSNGRTLGLTVLDVTKLKGQTLDFLNGEIFGPVLPIIQYSEITEAVEHIRSRAKPLALYLFSKNKKNHRLIKAATSSGAVCINELIIHLANHHLPFGGVGESGMGNYHGYYGFKTFSHEKAVLTQGMGGRLVTFFYPPYSDSKKKILRFFVRLGL
jgi:aldehyde dehydrogenase (NAD+)